MPRINLLFPYASDPIAGFRRPRATLSWAYSLHILGLGVVFLLYAWRVPRLESVFLQLGVEVPSLTRHAFTVAGEVRLLAWPLLLIALALVILSRTGHLARCPRRISLAVWVASCVAFTVPWQTGPWGIAEAAALSTLLLLVTVLCRPWRSAERAFTAANLAVLVLIGLLAISVLHNGRVLEHALSASN